MESILTSVKKYIGIAEDDTSFDVDVIMHINTAFAVLRQLGVGPSTVFRITDKETLWSSFTSEEEELSMAQSYVYERVKLKFDPPASSAHLQALKESVTESEWRLTVDAETIYEEEA